MKPSADWSQELQELRKELDDTDSEIVRLVVRRQEIVDRVIQRKQGQSKVIRDPQRERVILGRVEALAHSLGGSVPLVRKIFTEIISHSVSRQAATLSADGNEAKEIRIVHLAPAEGQDLHAAQKFAAGLKRPGHFLAAASIQEAAHQLQTGKADLALLPIENTLAGSINELYDLLREGDLHMVGEEIFGDEAESLTRYVALSRTSETFDQRIPCKTSLIITTRHEQGALMRCLQILSTSQLSLTKLESRPRPNRSMGIHVLPRF